VLIGIFVSTPLRPAQSASMMSVTSCTGAWLAGSTELLPCDHLRGDYQATASWSKDPPEGPASSTST